ncbi:hypothetical protein CVT24_007904 [Panaeolus cyanescens]|uniref:Uncharacterized protein n=1 Tax=Panaeolus cyanescens TaxID=181874 RepID=A0A409YQI7_9AGAR|nr:hypothetical protein CVT24_007904 [Panaeolus cyanescens]
MGSNSDTPPYSFLWKTGGQGRLGWKISLGRRARRKTQSGKLSSKM